MGAKSLKDLIVWQKADALSLLIHKITESFPAAERVRLGNQMRSASSSIPVNIAEGFGRWSPKDRARVYEIAKGSGDEVKAQLKQAMETKGTSAMGPKSQLLSTKCAPCFTRCVGRSFARTSEGWRIPHGGREGGTSAVC